LPGWLAVTEQVPTAVKVTVVPEIEQAPDATYLTDSPEVAVAERAREPGKDWDSPGLKLMDWAVLTLNVRTPVPSAKLPVAAAVAVREQVPVATAVIWLPVSVQAPVGVALRLSVT
jgi:hypothetical protein